MRFARLRIAFHRITRVLVNAPTGLYTRLLVGIFRPIVFPLDDVEVAHELLGFRPQPCHVTLMLPGELCQVLRHRSNERCSFKRALSKGHVQQAVLPCADRVDVHVGVHETKRASK